jgi:DNA-binding transcriptional LysR family regulator
LFIVMPELQAFVEVARTRNVSHAARALFITQPALSSRIQRLEKNLGAKLFARTPRGMRLTEAGEAFLPQAHRALDAIADGRRLVNAVEGGGVGRLSLGAAPALSTYVLPGILTRFAVSHPRVRVSVTTGHSEEILQLLLAERIDVGLVRALRHPDIVATPLYEDRLVLVVRPEHGFAATGRTRLEEIAREQLVTFDRASSYTELTNALFRDAGVQPEGVMELDNIEAAKKMVHEGFGVALLPQTAVAGELEAGTLRDIEIVDAEPVRRRLVAIRRRDRAPSGSTASFFAVLSSFDGEIT